MYRHEGDKIDWTKYYACIGEYVAEFENIVNDLRFTSSALFQMRGLKDWKLSEIVFGQKQFTADPLVSCFESLCNELFKDQMEAAQILKSISSFKSKFSKQIGVRNDLLHSTYLIGAGTITISDNPEPLTDLRVIKNSPTKKGARIKEVAKTIEDIQKNIHDLKELRKLFGTIRVDIIVYASNNNMHVGFKG